MLASAAAHLQAGSFDQAGGLLAAAQATHLNDDDTAMLDVLRARHATYRCDARTGAALHARAAHRLERIDIGRAFAAHLEALGAASMAGPDDPGSLRKAAIATLACPRSPEPNELEVMAAALARAIVDGTCGALADVRCVLSTPHDAIGPDAYHWLSYKSVLADALWDLDAYRDLAVTRVALSRTAGALSTLPSALNALARAMVWEGDLVGAAGVVREASEVMAVTGRQVALSAEVHHAALTGGDGAIDMVDDRVEAARVGGSGVGLQAALWARATIANGRGDYDTAFSTASEAVGLPWTWSTLTIHEHVEAAVRCGRREAANATLQRLISATSASGSSWALGIQERCRALISDGDDAERRYCEAIGHLRRTRLGPELARTHLLYGEWLRRENRRVDARAQLQAAYDMFVALGIRNFAERCRHELLSTGATVRRRAVASPGELTSQELEISRLAIDGFTNAEIGTRLFLSARTVEWHLGNVFAKLGVSSRRELKAVVRGSRTVASDHLLTSTPRSRPIGDVANCSDRSGLAAASAYLLTSRDGSFQPGRTK
jgi:DNA-binding CsgD family transcriptional regulator